MIGKRIPRHGIVALCLITVILAAHALTHPAAAIGMDARARTVVWSEPQDLDYDLAREERIELTASDLRSLPPQVIAAGACQTFKIWGEDSIALAFTDRGAAAYVGFLRGPAGYLVGEPKEFPFLYTWPGFPLGHAVQVQNRGLQRGFIAWPYYFMLGDPRLALQAGPPYRLRGDQMVGKARVLTFAAAPEGVIPVRLPGGAAYRFAEISGVGRAWQGDLFCSDAMQMADIGTGKYLFFRHTGGDFSVRLYRMPPWYWPAPRTVTDALGHVTAIHHSQGTMALVWMASGVLALIVAWVYLRTKPPVVRSLSLAIAAGLLLTALRGGYALARRAYLTTLYTHYLRTMDEAFEISLLFLIPSFLIAAGGAWLYLNARSRWGRSGGLLAILLPYWAIAASWLGSQALINALARQQYGLPLYAYGGGADAADRVRGRRHPDRACVVGRAASGAVFPVILNLSHTNLESRPGSTVRVEIRSKEQVSPQWTIP